MDRLVRLLSGLVLLAALAPDRAPARCVAHRAAHLRCRDGDPRCDIDGTCDGTCAVAICRSDLPGSQVPGCAPRVGLCGSSATPYETPFVDPGEPLKTRYSTSRSGVGSTSVTFRCLRKRASCTAPASTCSFTLDGAASGTFPCRAYVLAVDSGSSLISLSLPGSGTDVMMVFYGALPSPGAYVFGEGDYPPFGVLDGLYDVMVDVGAVAYHAIASAHAGAARLQLDAVEASGSVYHPIHGTLDATAQTDPYSHTGDLVHVHAVF